MPGSVTRGCRDRLVAHYGQPVTSWLEEVPARLAVAARASNLQLGGYHDAGHASALAVARTRDGTPVMLKAWFDRDRYRRETAALRHWEPVNGRVVREHDDRLAVACLEVVGGVPGGAVRPCDSDEQVANALARLHRLPASSAGFPSLDVYLGEEVAPRIRRRADGCGQLLPPRCLTLGLESLDRLPSAGTEPALLHTDLYQENVPFERGGRPVVLDPLPMIGDRAFDWAFWTVYFDLARDPVRRLRIAAHASSIAIETLVPWCLMLCLDGLLHYREVGDRREARMVEVMTALAGEGRLL